MRVLGSSADFVLDIDNNNTVLENPQQGFVTGSDTGLLIRKYYAMKCVIPGANLKGTYIMNENTKLLLVCSISYSTCAICR